MTDTFTNAIASHVLTSGADSTYATAHAGNSPTVGNTTTGAGNGAGRNNFDSSNYVFARHFFHFDTSAIPNDATIVSAFLRIPGENSSNNNVDSDTIGIYASTVSTDTTIAAGDWLNWGATLLGSLAMASYNNAANNDIALNASGLALISLTGYTKIMVMSTQDHAATQPTGLNNQTYTTTGLLLSVTYTTPAGGFFAFF